MLFRHRFIDGEALALRLEAARNRVAWLALYADSPADEVAEAGAWLLAVERQVREFEAAGGLMPDCHEDAEPERESWARETNHLFAV